MNSVTVNNRLPQQRVTPLHEFPPFRYVRMVSGHRTLRNHRSAGSTVGKNLCTCLTDGLRTGEGGMSMLSAGSRKPNALSTCVKGIPKSVSVRCGNLKGSSQSAKRQQCINPRNAARQARNNSAPKGAVINQATCRRVKSKCISSYGNTVPRSPFSSKPLLINAVTSVCTPFTSRPTILAISRMVSSPAPAIASRMFMRLGARILCINCQLGNEITSSPDMQVPSVAERNAASTSAVKSLISSTRMVTVFMSFPPADSFNVCQEVHKQLFNVDELSINLLIANMFMVTFTPFVVVTHDAYAINDVSHAVFEVVLATQNSRVNLPDSHSKVFCFSEVAFELFIQRSWHFCISLFLVVKNTNKLLCCQRLQQNKLNIIITPSTPAITRGQK